MKRRAGLPAERGSRIRLALTGLAVALAILAGLEGIARLALAAFPRLSDPWSSKAAGRFFRGMESDLNVVEQRQRLYVEDRTLFWRLAPGVNMAVENKAIEPRDQALLWTIRTNESGFRGQDLSAQRSGLRVITVGDSSTFGFRVNGEDTYAERLGHMCGRPVQVLNAGIPGYTSYQGKILLRSLLQRYHPDVVTIAFGANDRQMEPVSDAEWGARLGGSVGQLTYAVERLGLYRVLAGLFPGRASAGTGPTQARVSVPAYRANVDEMISIATEASARVVLLDLTYFAPVYRYILQDLSVRRNVPFLDGPVLFDRTFDDIERGSAYQTEARAWIDFYDSHVKGIRPVYFDQAFYESHYATDAQRRQFKMLMADPIHPNPLGHRILADNLAPLVCGAPK